MNADKCKVELQVLVAGKPAREYGAEGRVLVEGTEGAPFTLKVKNSEGRRIMAVVSVDGVNVVTGQPATGKPDEIGYVLPPFGSYEIEGWRTSDKDVARFVFTNKETGYAKTVTGETSGMGVIGLAVHYEKDAPKPKPQPEVKIIEKHIHHHHNEPVWPWYPGSPYYPRPYRYWGDRTICSTDEMARGSGVTFTAGGTGAAAGATGDESYSSNTLRSMGAASAAAGDDAPRAMMTLSCFPGAMDNVVMQASAEAAPEVFSLGTGWGESVKSEVMHTTFTTHRIVDVVSIHYMAQAGLKALGIDVKKSTTVAFPQAFGGYCKPPAGVASKT